ncbi:MAG: carbohydrate kinase family protein, partial [Armatimonadota bacterium]
DEARHWIWQAMPLAKVAKLAEEEWEFVVGTADLREGAKKILDAGPKLVVVTRGGQGCYYDDGDSYGYVPAFPVKVVDPLGAGDGFVAAMLSLLKDEDLDRRLKPDRLREIMTYANAAGALTTQKVGVIPALPTRPEVLEFLAAAG